MFCLWRQKCIYLACVGGINAVYQGLGDHFPITLSMHSQITQREVYVLNAGKENRCVKYITAALVLVLQEKKCIAKYMVVIFTTFGHIMLVKTAVFLLSVHF